MDSSPAPTDQSSGSVDPNVAGSPAAAAKDVSAQNNVQQAKAFNASDASSTVSSIGDLQAKSPELFKKMMEGIAQQICKEMKEAQARLKKNMRGQ